MPRLIDDWRGTELPAAPLPKLSVPPARLRQPLQAPAVLSSSLDSLCRLPAPASPGLSRRPSGSARHGFDLHAPRFPAPDVYGLRHLGRPAQARGSRRRLHRRSKPLQPPPHCRRGPDHRPRLDRALCRKRRDPCRARAECPGRPSLVRRHRARLLHRDEAAARPDQCRLWRHYGSPHQAPRRQGHRRRRPSEGFARVEEHRASRKSSATCTSPT